jgi:hypothetical protein
LKFWHFSPVPRITQMRPQVRAISPLRAENPQRRDSLAERNGFELPVPRMEPPDAGNNRRERPVLHKVVDGPVSGIWLEAAWFGFGSGQCLLEHRVGDED